MAHQQRNLEHHIQAIRDHTEFKHAKLLGPDDKCWGSGENPKSWRISLSCDPEIKPKDVKLKMAGPSARAIMCLAEALVRNAK